MPVSTDTRLGAVHLYALGPRPDQSGGHPTGWISVKWCITHYDGERWVVFHLFIQPAEESIPTHWALCKNSTDEIPYLETRTLLAVQLSAALSLDIVEGGISSAALPTISLRLAIHDGNMPLRWAACAASCIHMVASGVMVDDFRPSFHALNSYGSFAIGRFLQGKKPVRFGSWPLPGPARVYPGGITLWVYRDSDGDVADSEWWTPGPDHLSF